MRIGAAPASLRIILAAVLAVAVIASIRPFIVCAAGGDTRQDPKTGVSVTLPSTWTFTAVASCVFSMQRRDDKDVSAYLKVVTFTEPITSKEYATSLLESYKTQYPKCTFSRISDTRLAAQPAASFIQKQPDVADQVVWTIAVKGLQGYILIASMPVSEADGALPEVDAIKGAMLIQDKGTQAGSTGQTPSVK